ncbi:cation-translocating P-type ATPase [Thiohalorhabdus sp. Cl-TMA]|uniref:HAD-IC family P-type ATPase n=1 Tax=Thiohalorhabdus methylotrophus TaxID=3242694 RepID=A0ABV4TQJ4_9GAMM
MLSGLTANSVEPTPAAPGQPFSIRHAAVRGRTRFAIPALHRNPGLGTRLEEEMGRLSGIHSVRASSRTGSLLAHHTPDLTRSALQDVLGSLLAEAVPDTGTERGGATADKADAAGDGGTPGPGTTPWHSHAPQQAARLLETSPHTGLSPETAEARLREEGPNRLGEDRPRSVREILLDQVLNVPVGLLVGSAGISVATGGVLDAAVILAVVGVNAAIGYATERQSERTIRSLTRAAPQQATVLRGGRRRHLDAEDLVSGDLLEISPGTTVPADVRLVRSHRLSVDESSLTGESLPVEKEAAHRTSPDTPLGERRNMAYMGTLVTGGSGRGFVVGKGAGSEIGRIQAMLGTARSPATPMQRQLDMLGKRLVLISAAACAAVFLLGLLRSQSLLTMLKSTISLAVAAVPEGLPTVATTTLAMGIRDMRRHQVAVRRIGAVETLGSVQVFCLDKTGTLTLNKMSLVQATAGESRFTMEEGRLQVGGAPAESAAHPELTALLETAALCSEAEIAASGQAADFTGSPTETALLEAARDAGIGVGRLRRRHPLATIHHRAEGRPYMTTIHEPPEGGQVVLVKGSPASVLERCTRFRANGEAYPLDEGHRRRILGDNEAMAGDGLRVLGLAARKVAPGVDHRGGRDLEWLGLVGLADPIRPGMREVIQQFHRAGIETIMITGDQTATAYAIGKRLGLAGGDSLEILDSTRLEKMDPEVLRGVVPHVHVFSRVSPAHKLQIVEALQHAGRVVAMTGDGVNDGPALKAADIGVAMGRSGTQVARSVADVVLEDDELATMGTAIGRGRTIYGNIQKAVHFLLATNFSEIAVMLSGTLFTGSQILTPMQLLWINLVTDIFPGLALSLEPEEVDVLDRSPRDPEEPIIPSRTMRRTALETATLTAGSLGVYALSRWRYGPGTAAGSHAFTALTLGQLLHAVSTRSEQRVLWGSPRRHNPHLAWALGGAAGAQLLASGVPALRGLLGTTAMGWRDGLAVAAGAGLPLLINEATKPAAPYEPPGEDAS